MRRPMCALAGVLLAGCSLHGEVFVDNASITIDAPRAEQKLVGQPVTVSWHLAAKVTPPASYAVYVDTTPPAVGDAIPVRTDPLKGVVVVDSTRVELPRLRLRDEITRTDSERHNVTVILVDAEHRRSSEVSGYVTFQVRP